MFLCSESVLPLVGAFGLLPLVDPAQHASSPAAAARIDEVTQGWVEDFASDILVFPSDTDVYEDGTSAPASARSLMFEDNLPADTYVRSDASAVHELYLSRPLTLFNLYLSTYLPIYPKLLLNCILTMHITNRKYIDRMNLAWHTNVPKFVGLPSTYAQLHAQVTS